MLNNNSDLNICQFGNEREYSLNGIWSGLTNINQDLAYLVRSHQIFIKLSNYNERSSIVNQLNNIVIYLQNLDFNNLVSTIESLKVILRSFNIRLDKDRFIDFNNAIDASCRLAQSLETEITKTRERLETTTTQLEKANEYYISIEEENELIITKRNELLEEIEALRLEAQNLQSIITSANSSNQTITASLTTAKSNEGIIKQFAESVTNRDSQLEKQQQKTNEYIKQLDIYTKERDDLQKTANDLIQEAKKALNYKSAEGLSAAFSHKLEQSNTTFLKAGWLIGAGFFILVAFGLGAWIVAGWKISNTGNELYSLIGRITMMPIAFTAAMFCANQYLKQKQIIEDYAYKTVLAKSIISFSEALKEGKGQEYPEYISTVLKEIHKDPMRKRGKDEIDSKQSFNIMSQFVELFKTIKTN
jgi:hypothetical protein